MDPSQPKLDSTQDSMHRFLEECSLQRLGPLHPLHHPKTSSEAWCQWASIGYIYPGLKEKMKVYAVESNSQETISAVVRVVRLITLLIAEEK